MKKGRPLKPSITIEAWYYRELRIMVLAMQKAMIRAAENPYKPVAMDAAGIPTRKDVKTACKQTNPNPTDAQAKAENYQTGKLNYCGLTISIENPRKSTRRGRDQSGKKWSQKMRHTYGRILGTLGFDGDHIDAFINDARPYTDTVFIIKQVDHKGKFDEEKVMLGFDNENAAKAAYLQNYAPGWRGFGSIRQMTFQDFKKYARGSVARDEEVDNVSVEARAQELRAKFDAALTELGSVAAAELMDKQIKFASRSFVRSVRSMVEGKEPSLMLSGSIVTPANLTFTEEAIKTNVALIRSIGEQYFDRIEKEILKSLQTGGSTPDLIKAIREVGGVTERRARIIARDQNSKIYSQLAENNMKNAGITKVMWRHGGGGKVPRTYHKRPWNKRPGQPNGLNGYVYQIGNPPVADLKTGVRANPGELINCSCFQVPVLDV